MRHASLLVLALTACSACTDSESTSVDSVEVFSKPCDLSEVAALDQQPGDVHYVVDSNGRVFNGKTDVTDLVKPLVCISFASEQAIESVTSGDWITFEGNNAIAGVHGIITGSGNDARLIYETRTYTSERGLFAFRGETLARTRSWTIEGSLFAAGHSDLALATSFDQLVDQNPGKYQPLTFTYTFR
jgi:hypothetical protein